MNNPTGPAQLYSLKAENTKGTDQPVRKNKESD